MDNKTCNDCKHCENKQVIATCKHIGITTGDVPGSDCKWFERRKSTYGDKVRQMSNKELAEFKQKLSCGNCVYFDIKMSGQEFCHKPENKTCVDGVEAWLDQEAKDE